MSEPETPSMRAGRESILRNEREMGRVEGYEQAKREGLGDLDAYAILKQLQMLNNTARQMNSTLHFIWIMLTIAFAFYVIYGIISA